MKIFFDQIPDGISFQDYPEDTEFIMDDSRPKWDPVTCKRIPLPERPKIYPEDVRRIKEESGRGEG